MSKIYQIMLKYQFFFNNFIFTRNLRTMVFCFLDISINLFLQIIRSVFGVFVKFIIFFYDFYWFLFVKDRGILKYSMNKRILWRKEMQIEIDISPIDIKNMTKAAISTKFE